MSRLARVLEERFPTSGGTYAMMGHHIAVSLAVRHERLSVHEAERVLLAAIEHLHAADDHVNAILHPDDSPESRRERRKPSFTRTSASAAAASTTHDGKTPKAPKPDGRRKTRGPGRKPNEEVLRRTVEIRRSGETSPGAAYRALQNELGLKFMSYTQFRGRYWSHALKEA